MIRNKSLRYALLLALGVFLTTSGHAQQPQPAPPAAKPAKAPSNAAEPAVELYARAQSDRAPEGRQQPSGRRAHDGSLR